MATRCRSAAATPAPPASFTPASVPSPSTTVRISTYGKIDWNHQAFHVGFFANFLDADSDSLLTRGTNGQFLPFAFATDTYNLEASNTSLPTERLILTYGANARTERLRSANRPQRHQEGRVRRLRAGRDPARRTLALGDRRHATTTSTRSAASVRPAPPWSSRRARTTRFRLSYNQAFRAPSVINSYLDTTIILATPPIPPFGLPFVFPVNADGNVALEEETLEAIESSATPVRSATAVPRPSRSTTTRPKTRSTSTRRRSTPPESAARAGTLPPLFLRTSAPPDGIQRDSVANSAIATSARPSTRVSSCRAATSARLTPCRGTSTPPTRRIRSSSSTGVGPELAARSSRTGRRSHAPTSACLRSGPLVRQRQRQLPGRGLLGRRARRRSEPPTAFTTLNAALGVRLMDERMTIQVTGSNLTDEEIQQHIFGDIISRKITGQVAFRF